MSEVPSSSSEQVQQQEDSSNIDYRCAAAQDRQAFSSMVNEYHRREQERRKTLTVRRRLANREKRKEDHRVFLMERFSLHSEGGDAATTLHSNPTDEALKSVELKVGVKVRKKFDGARRAFDGEVVAIAPRGGRRGPLDVVRGALRGRRPGAPR